MQVVILAAGKGTRMGTLTQTTPKPLLPVGGLTLLEQKFHILPPEVKEVIIAIGYKGNEIRKYLGAEHLGYPIRYIEDNEMTGTGGTTWKAKEHIEGDFLVLMSDDFYHADDIASLAKHRWAMLGQFADTETPGDYIKADEAGNFLQLVGYPEYTKHHEPGSLPINTAAYKLHADIFEHPLVEYKPGEYGLPQTIDRAVKTASLPVKVLSTKHWYQVNTPEQYEEAKTIAHRYFKSDR